jgi:hypothetical protein
MAEATAIETEVDTEVNKKFTLGVKKYNNNVEI